MIEQLNLNFGTGWLPREITIGQLLLLFFCNNPYDERNQTDLRRFVASRKKKVATDSIDADGNWLEVEHIINRVRSTKAIGTQIFRTFHGLLQGTDGLTDITVDQCDGWNWAGTRCTQGWLFPTRVWMSRLCNEFGPY